MGRGISAAQIEHINTLHKQFEKLLKKGAAMAFEIGEKLNEIMVGLGSCDSWPQWCKDNLAFDVSTAYKYMRVYENFKNNPKLLAGETSALIIDLTTQMHEAARELKFEEAAALRNAIRAVESLSEANTVEDMDQESRDYIAWAAEGIFTTFCVLSMRGGRMTGQELFSSRSAAEENESIETFLVAYYSPDRLPPPRIFLLPRRFYRTVLQPASKTQALRGFPLNRLVCLCRNFERYPNAFCFCRRASAKPTVQATAVKCSCDLSFRVIITLYACIYSCSEKIKENFK